MEKSEGKYILSKKEAVIPNALSRVICTLVLIAAPLTIAETQRQPSVHQQMNGKKKCAISIVGIFFSLNKEGNYIICDNTDEPGRH